MHINDVRFVFTSSRRRAHVLLSYLCLFAHSGVEHIVCCVFLRLVYHMIPLSQNCPFLISPSVFSNVYFSDEQSNPWISCDIMVLSIAWLIDLWCFISTFSNISAISWRPVLMVEEARLPGENQRLWASNW